jgi:hypothetical protein
MPTLAGRLRNSSEWGHRFHLSNEDRAEIRRTLGDTPLYVLRRAFGEGFAYGAPGDITVNQALALMDPSSQIMLMRKLVGGLAN